MEIKSISDNGDVCKNGSFMEKRLIVPLRTSPKPAFAEFLCRFFPEGQYESLLSIKRADMVIPFMSEKALVLYLLMKIRNGLRV